MGQIGKAMLGIGVAIALIGAGLMAAERFGLPLGRLPGDFSFKGRNVSLYFPLGTSILISVVLSVILYLLSHLRR